MGKTLSIKKHQRNACPNNTVPFSHPSDWNILKMFFSTPLVRNRSCHTVIWNIWGAHIWEDNLPPSIQIGTRVACSSSIPGMYPIDL